MKNNTFYRAALKTSAASLVLSIGLLAGPALAQTAAAEATEANANDAETIVVTGSRIARPDLEAASPVAVLGSEEFQLSGSVNVEEVIYDLPQIVPSLTAASNNPGEGVATVDLRGLGASRTLVLVNSRRYVSYDEQQIVDLNTIPAALIERVDVVTGGRSAIYGSDAIAGVVNFILKDDFEGAQISSSYRLTERGDGASFTLDTLLGGNFADGRGNATVYASYLKRKPIFQSDRGYASNSLVDNGDGTTFFGGSSSIPGFGINVPGITGRQRFDANGNLVPYVSTTDQYNYAPTNYLQTPQERFFLGGFANYEINDQVELYAETQFINSRVNSQLAPTPVTGNYDLPVDNPFLNAATQARLRAVDTDGDGLVNVAVFKRLEEAGPRFQLDDRNAYRVLLGSRGDLVGNWGYDGYYSFARSRNIQTQEGNVSISRFQQALLATRNPDGTITTEDGVPAINPFGAGAALATPEGVAFVTVPTSNLFTITEQVAQFALNNGQLFDLPGGPAGIALGAEWRSVNGDYRPDAFLSSGDVVGFNAGQPTNGGYNVKELFIETVLPVLGDMPFAHKLELNGAFRYSDYSNAVGTATSYSAGGQYAPIEDLTFRGQYQRAVRAPTVNQLFLGQAVGFPPATDPCEQPEAVSNTNLRANCIAQGVPAAVLGTDFAGGNSQQQGIFGGNPDLREETADTYTIGGILAPRALPGLTLTVDYYNIKVEDYIGAAGPGVTNILAACYGNGASNFVPYDASLCALAPRDPNSLVLTNVESINANLGTLKTSGVDFEVRYGMDLPFGFLGEEDSRLNIRVSGTRLLNWELTPLASAPGLVNECEGNFGTTCGDPFSKWRGSARLTWLNGPLTTSVGYRYIGSARDDDPGTTYFAERFKAEHYVDLSFNYQVNEIVDFTFGIDNLFDNDVPIAGSNAQQANTYPSTYDPFGRRYFVSVTATF